MARVGLVVIYNHKYNANITKVEQIYRHRFSNIHHLMPFYDGDLQNVIPVYDCSFQFEGYVAQAYTHIGHFEYDHCIFIGDDLILNPIINEHNYLEHLRLALTSCYIPQFKSLHEQAYWDRTRDAFRYRVGFPGVEASRLLPDYDTAMQHFGRFNLRLKALRYSQIWRTPPTIVDIAKKLRDDPYYPIRWLLSVLLRRSYKLPYPLVGSYSDIFVVSNDAAKAFATYCGIFAATRLHAEVAVPTAMVLSAQDIKTDADLALKGKALWLNHPSWLQRKLGKPLDTYVELEPYHGSIKALLNNFPHSYLYLHPVKLSKWSMDI